MADFTIVKLTRNGDKSTEFDAYLYGPENAPGVVVIQEWWGVDYEIKNHAKFISSKGYRTLVPDLYRGTLALDEAEAQHLLQGLDWPGAVKDIAASAKWLKDNGSSKVGVVGFCMGGALSVASSVLVEDLSAAVTFYGIPPPQLADPTLARVPTQGHFGELDSHAGFSDTKSAKLLGEKLEKSGVQSEIHIYPGQGHAFVNASEEAISRKLKQGNPAHDQAAVDLAWSRSFEWFGKYLS